MHRVLLRAGLGKALGIPARMVRGAAGGRGRKVGVLCTGSPTTRADQRSGQVTGETHALGTVGRHCFQAPVILRGSDRRLERVAGCPREWGLKRGGDDSSSNHTCRSVVSNALHLARETKVPVPRTQMALRENRTYRSYKWVDTFFLSCPIQN